MLVFGEQVQLVNHRVALGGLAATLLEQEVFKYLFCFFYQGWIGHFGWG